MTYVSLPSNKNNIPARTDEGVKGILFPITGHPEYKFVQNDCKNCTKKDDHGQPACQIGYIPQYNNPSYDDVPSDSKLDKETLDKLQVALWNASYIHNGVLRGTLYNLNIGTANNISQQETYEIISSSNRFLEIKGKDPRLMSSGFSQKNFNFPLEAPAEMRPAGISDESWDIMKFARLISSGIEHSLSLGAAIFFHFPSILWDKTECHVTKIQLPTGEPSEDVTFTVECSSTITNAMQPYDLAFPPDKYYCTLYYYIVGKEDWSNYQIIPETWFTKKQITITKSELDTLEGMIPLLDTDGQNCKVLSPSMCNMLVKYRVTNNPIPYVFNLNDSHIIINQIGGSFTSTLNLSSLLSLEILETIDVIYFPQAYSDDDFIFPYNKTCANDQAENTGTFEHSDGRRCTNVDCQKFKDNQYVAGNCWRTINADKFTLNNSNFETHNPLDSNNLQRLWNRTSIIIEQGLNGVSSYRNFAYKRISGPSLSELTGNYFDEVAFGNFPTKYAAHMPSLGQRREYTVSGNKFHEIIYGNFNARTYNQDWSDKGFDGSFKVYISGWNSRNGYKENSLSATQGLFYLYGAAPKNLYNYNLETNGMMMPKKISTIENQVFSTGNGIVILNSTQNEKIQGVI
jgi:hypothetical protein